MSLLVFFRSGGNGNASVWTSSTRSWRATPSRRRRSSRKSAWIRRKTSASRFPKSRSLSFKTSGIMNWNHLKFLHQGRHLVVELPLSKPLGSHFECCPRRTSELWSIWEIYFCSYFYNNSKLWGRTVTSNTGTSNTGTSNTGTSNQENGNIETGTSNLF